MLNKIEIESRKINLVKKLNTLYKYCDILEEAIQNIEPPLLTSLSKKTDEDLVDYLLFLKKDDTLITTEEIDFINRLLGFSFSEDKLNIRKRTIDNDDSITLPAVLCVAIDIEKTMNEKNNLTITKLICEIYIEIGTVFLNVNNNFDLDDSLKKLQSYEDVLIDFISNKVKEG